MSKYQLGLAFKSNEDALKEKRKHDMNSLLNPVSSICSGDKEFDYQTQGRVDVPANDK